MYSSVGLKRCPTILFGLKKEEEEKEKKKRKQILKLCTVKQHFIAETEVLSMCLSIEKGY